MTLFLISMLRSCKVNMWQLAVHLMHAVVPSCADVPAACSYHMPHTNASDATCNMSTYTWQGALRDFAHGTGKEGDAGGRVLLVIAHRIDTILDTDHLLVLSSGSLVEQGPPAELSTRPGGMFAGMVAAARHAHVQHALPAPASTVAASASTDVAAAQPVSP